MKAYHYLLIAIAAFPIGIPLALIDLSHIKNQWLFIGGASVVCLVLAGIGFSAFMTFLDLSDQESRMKRWRCRRVATPQKLS